MALQPIPNYGINAVDPVASFQQGIQMRQQFEARQLAQDEAENIKRDIGALGSRPSVSAITDLITKYPQLGERFKAKLGQLSDEEKQNRLSIATPIYAAMQNGKPDVAKALLRQQADALRNSGNEQGVKDAEAQIKLIELDPGTATTSFGVTLGGIMGPDNFQKTFGELREQQLQPGRIKELDAKAKKDAAGAGFEVFKSEILPNGTSVMVSRDGLTRVQDATGKVLTGADATLAIEMAREAETRYRRNIAGAEAGAKAGVEAETRPGIERSVEEARNAAKIANDALTGLTKISSNISTLNRALQLSNNGANTGVIARYFPNITASSVELAQLRNQLGLDVVGGATFGALSAGELNLALDTALPTGLDEPQLAEWLKTKIAAQEKVRTELLKKAKHFSKGGTVASWIGQIESGAPGAAQQPVVSVDY